MSTLNGVFDIAKTALLTTQKAISVTSHNIANANTEGYTRQRAVLETTNPIDFGGVFFGTGVDLQGVERVYDSFQEIQLRSAISSQSMYESKGQHLSALEGILNDFGGSGLSSRLDDFFNAAQDVSTNPSSYGERAAMLSTARVLTDTVNNIDSGIRQNMQSLSDTIGAKANDINNLSDQIAKLNQQIANTEVSGSSANDLRDKRDLALENLSKLVDITTSENSSGQVDVYVGGSYLVAGTTTAELTLEANPKNPDIPRLSLNGSTMNDRLGGGSLKGDLEGLAFFQDVHDRINRLAASITKEVNLVHQNGYALDGSTGNDFFTPIDVYSASNTSNTGGAVASGGAVTDLSLLTLDDYEVRFSGPGAYTVVDTKDQRVVGGGAYTSGSAITFEGLSVNITDGTKPPAAGDRFTVSPTKFAAMKMGLAITDPRKIAASSSLAGVPGDNANALALADLSKAPALDRSTFSQYYSRIITDMGTAANDAKVNFDSQSKFAEQLTAAKQSVSGVSIDEEAVNLVKLQRAYEAAAKVMSTVDQMLDTLMNIR